MLLAKDIENSLTTENLYRLSEICQFAARLAAEKLLEEPHGEELKLWQKRPGDWVTQADFKAQQAIQTYLLDRFPSHQFLGEEQTEANQRSRDKSDTDFVEFIWIVDPLDGTVNYIHQLRSFSVSIALVARDKRSLQAEILVGCVYDPMNDEMFSAIRGKGAWMNDRPIGVSKCVDVQQALLVVSSNTKAPADDPQVQRIIKAMGTSASVRRLGSAALNLCYVASGQVDAYWASNLNSWDVAAGWLIAMEAGAKLNSLDPSPLNLDKPNFCCAATDPLWAGLQPILLI